MVRALLVLVVGSVGCIAGCIGECPEGTPDSVRNRASTMLETPETFGDTREIGSYGHFRENGVHIAFLFQHPDLGTDWNARNEWIGHLVFEWPQDDAPRELELDPKNCRFVIDGDGSHEQVVEGPLSGSLVLPGYDCRGSATRVFGSGGDVTVEFDAHFLDEQPVGRALGEYTRDYREPTCGGVIDDD